MDPFLKYPGGKTKELNIIRSFLPRKIERYFEPFVGGGSVYLDLNIKSSFINDKSIDLINLYKFVQKKSTLFKKRIEQINKLWKKIETKIDEEDFNKCSLNYFKFKKFLESSSKRKAKTIGNFKRKGIVISKEDLNKINLSSIKTAFYMLIRDLYNTSFTIIDKTASFYFLREYCYSSMFRFSKNGDFNVPYGGMSYNNKHLNKKINQMFSDKTTKYLSNTKIYCMDFEDFLNKFKFNCNDFIFLDPPYDSEFSTYDNNSFDKNEQIRLCNFLKRTKGKWMLVIKETEFIKKLYKDFNYIKYDKEYNVSFKNRNNKKVEHLLISNYSFSKRAAK